MPKSWTGSLTTPGDMEMDSSSDSDESSDLDHRSIGIVAIGSLHLPSRLAIVPEETFDSLSQRLSNSEKTMVALVPIFAPYPFFCYPDRDEVISSSVRRVWIMEKNEDTFILVVRTPDDDVVVPISTLGMDDKIQMIDVVTSTIANYGYSPISVTDYTGALNIQHWTIAGLKLIFLGVLPTIGFVDTTSGAFEFRLEFKDYGSVVKPLRFLMARAEALVQQASRIGKGALQLIHLARSIIHLIICAQEVLIEIESLDSADYCTDLHKLLDDLQDSIESPTHNLESIFYNLCEDRPGASAIRRSYNAFLELGASDSPRCEQLHAPLGSPSTAGLDNRTRLPQNVNREEFKPIEASLSAQSIGAWLPNTTVPTRDERQLRTTQAPKSLIRDDRKKPRPCRQDIPPNTGAGRPLPQYNIPNSDELIGHSPLAWTSPYGRSSATLHASQQYDYSNQGPLISLKGLSEYQLRIMSTHSEAARHGEAAVHDKSISGGRNSHSKSQASLERLLPPSERLTDLPNKATEAYLRNLTEGNTFGLLISEPTLFYGRQSNQVTSGSLRPITTTNEGPSGSNGQSHAVLQTGPQSAQKLGLSPFGRYLVSRVGHDELQSEMLSWVTSFLPRKNHLGEGCGPVIVSMKSLKKAESGEILLGCRLCGFPARSKGYDSLVAHIISDHPQWRTGYPCIFPDCPSAKPPYYGTAHDLCLHISTCHNFAIRHDASEPCNCLNVGFIYKCADHTDFRILDPELSSQAIIPYPCTAKEVSEHQRAVEKYAGNVKNQGRVTSWINEFYRTYGRLPMHIIFAPSLNKDGSEQKNQAVALVGCAICGEPGQDLEEIMPHIISNHIGSPGFLCERDQCERAFYRRGDLQRHEREDHGNQPTH
ncbi:hypothetical protein FRC17_002496 [Serendipita sp. 399]|nr:hypothetical protein FRC17_002496 [Serendipita sp. 399]